MRGVALAALIVGCSTVSVFSGSPRAASTQQAFLDRYCRTCHVNAANEAGQTPLHFAALSMDSVVELLVKNGAKLDATDRQGRTPMDMANGKGGPGRAGQAASPRQSTIELLRKLGAR